MKQTLQLGVHPGLALLYTTTAAIADALRRHAERQARRHEAHRTEQSLAGLDAYALRDLGLTRSEIRSVASEIVGDTESSRRHVALLHR